MKTQTKMICTMGPSVAEKKKLEALIDAGMNVARINMSHGDYNKHEETIQNLKEVRQKKGVPLSILLDTKGPEIRLGQLDEEKMLLEQGKKIRLGTKMERGEILTLPITPPSVLREFPLGTQVLFCDGYISSKVIDTDPDGVTIQIENSGVVSTGKGINVPHVNLDLPAVTDQDIEDIRFGCRQKFDLIAASFIRSEKHIFAIKELLASENSLHILVFAKIESALGVKHFDSILQAADGIMVARGDLGVELPLEEVPKLQKMMIKKCNRVLKPVVTATQMLESMIHHPRPTRAEVSDVANAVYDGTDLVMLSGETAVGNYPIEAALVMKQTILAAEKDMHYRNIFSRETDTRPFFSTAISIAMAAVQTAYVSNAKGIIALTSNGLTARMMAAFRPEMPIIAITADRASYHQLACFWGVIPFFQKVSDLEEGVECGSEWLLEQGKAENGDLVIVTSGSPFGVGGTTNMIRINHIGQVIVRGKPATGEEIPDKKVSAPVTLAAFKENILSSQVSGKIAVILFCDKHCEPLLKDAVGIILQNHPYDLHSEKWAYQIAKKLDIPLLVQANAATHILKENQEVTIDPRKGVVFSKNKNRISFL